MIGADKIPTTEIVHILDIEVGGVLFFVLVFAAIMLSNAGPRRGKSDE